MVESANAYDLSLKDFFENGTVGLHLVGADGTILNANRADFEPLGYSAEEYIGRSITEFHADPDTIQDILERLTRGERLDRYRAQLRGKDGSLRHVEIWSSVCFSEGAFANTRCFTIDVTEAVRAEEALRVNEERHRTLIETLPQLVWTCQPDGTCDYLSPQWVAYTGVPMEEQLGMNWVAMVIHPDDAERTTEHWWGAVAGHHAYDIEYRIRGGDGSFRWFKTRGTPIRADDNTIAYWFGTCTDVQEFVEARHALARSQTELEEQVAREVAERLRAEEALRQSQKMEAIGQLTGGLAHDFNNLLTVIRGSVDFLRRENLAPEKRKRYIDAIDETATRAAKLTGQLLAFARRQALKPESFDCVESIRVLADMMATLTGSRITLDLLLPKEACFALADRSQFDTAVVNLALNARDAMNGEGVLRIEMKAVSGIPESGEQPAISGEYVAVAISDAGSGIAPEDLPRIFEPFYTTKEVGHGTGLGLSQVIGFSRQSGGDVRVDSRLGEGSTFTLYLPRSAAPAAGAASPQEEEADRGGAGICVLVVEDNPQVGEFATQALRELGYDSQLAHSGAEALAALASDCDRFHVVFSDVVMAGMSGLDLGREIRRLYPNVPVVLTSGYSHVLAENGARGFELLDKPYSVEQLSRVLSKVLRAQRAPQ